MSSLDLQRGYSDDAAEADDGMMNGPMADETRGRALKRGTAAGKAVKSPTRMTRAGSTSRMINYDQSNMLNGVVEPSRLDRKSVV